MADKYLYSGAAGAGTGADWTNAYTTMTAAVAGMAAGDTLYVAHDHAESTAGAVSLAFPGTSASPNRVLCVNRAGSVPPVAADVTTGGSVATSTANNIAMTGIFYCEGLTFNAGTAAGASAASINLSNSFGSAQTFKNCALRIDGSTSAAGRINIGTAPTILDNTTVRFGSVSQAMSPANAGSRLLWINTSSAVLGSVPTTLITATQAEVLVDGVDLSALGSGKTLAGISGSAPIRFQNCKLGASVTIASNPSSMHTARGIEVVNCNSTGVTQRNEAYRYQGTLTTETTIVRTGGASDGTTAYSWKIATTANNERDFPFETFEGAVWNTATGSAKTLTVHTVTDNVTLTDAEIWLEVEYLGSSATPVTSLITDANATVLTTAANQAVSTETWTTTGLGTPVYQKLEVTFTPQMAGPIRWRVKVTKVSTTVYVCPKAEIS